MGIIIKQTTTYKCDRCGIEYIIENKGSEEYYSLPETWISTEISRKISGVFMVKIHCGECSTKIIEVMTETIKDK